MARAKVSKSSEAQDRRRGKKKFDRIEFIHSKNKQLQRIEIGSIVEV